jgi:uncharacterized protein YidB (DUF937 family)
MDSIKQQAGQQAGQAGNDTLISGVLSMFGGNSGGGIGTLVETFRQKGLAGVAESWVSTGRNIPISPDQVEQVLGNERVQQLCAKFHISPEIVKSVLAEHLPNAVDRMTPAITVDAWKSFLVGKSAGKLSMRRKAVARMGESCRFHAAKKNL